jgi:hypothetical protein
MRRHVALTLAIGTLLALPVSALAAPPAGGSQTKEQVGPSTQPQAQLSREQAYAQLVRGEAMLEQQTGDGLALMAEAYFALEGYDGPEAPGVKELRGWLIKALDTLEFRDEAQLLRQRGSFVDHPLSVMPSTWFKTSGSVTSEVTMTQAQAEAALARGLELLQRGDVDGLGLIVDAYFAIEALQGPESGDAQVMRTFLVGLLEAGGFTDEGQALRRRGSVAPPTPEDSEVYAATWLAILEREQARSAAPSGAVARPDIKTLSGGGSITTTPSEPTTIDEPEEPEDKRRRRERGKVDFEKGSARPSLGLDLGLGSFQPTLGTKGWMWTLGLDVHWTLFRVGVFGMQLGGAGQFGRNRDKRWMTDAYADLRLLFDFDVVYFTPEFGGGYDGIAGGTRPITEALRWNHAPYYHFGGGLGVRIGEKFGIYGRAVRLNRGDAAFAHETRIRGGFLVYLDKAAIDLAFAFTDYESAAETDPSARQFMGVVGFRI